MNNVIRRSAAITLLAVMLFAFVPAVNDVDYVSAAAKPARVRITTAKLVNQNIVLKWKKAKRASKYQVFIKVGKKAWKKKATVKATKYTVKKCKWNTNYQVKVRGIKGSAKGPFSTTYKGKTSKKTNLEKLLKRAPGTLESMNDIMEEQLAGTGFRGNVKVDGNNLVFNYIFENAIPESSVPEYKTGLENALNQQEIKAAVKKQKKTLEEKGGIYGVGIDIRYLNADETLIAHKLFK